MRTKRFSVELYNENDKLARKATKKLFKNISNFTVVDNEKKLDVDLLVYNSKTGKHLFNIEVERKKVWESEFKFNSVQFASRKEKYALSEVPTFFLMFNNDFSQYLLVTSKDLLASPKVEVPNKYVFKGELFFQVPIKRVSFNSLDKILNVNWE